MRRFFGRSPAPGGPASIIAGDATPDPDRTEDTIILKHATNTHTLTFPAHAITSGTTTVGDVRAAAAHLVELDPARCSLICAGKNLKDDTATLQSLGISTAAKILLMGSAASIPAAGAAAGKKKNKKRSGAKKAAGGAATPERRELSPMEKIDAVWDGVVANLMPLVEEFMGSPPEDEGKRRDVHRRLSETMMGELLKLDSVESGEPEVRVRRKGVVKDIQKVLDGLDRVLKEKEQVDFDLD